VNVRERRKAQALEEIRELVYEYGAERTELLLKVHATTVQRWIDGTVAPSEAVLIALRAAAYGVMPGMAVQHWKGWRFGHDGMLYSPIDKRGLWPSHIAAIHYERQMLASFRQENRDLRERLEKALYDGNTAANDPVMVTLRSR